MSDFTRDRCLSLEHTLGLVMSMALDRNGNGYDISSQNYFRELSDELKRKMTPARHQSVSVARSKLSFEAFEYLLGASNLEKRNLSDRFKFKGHVTRAIDGTSFHVPRTKELLKHFSPRKTRSAERETHYPYGLCVAAINVFTNQPVCAVVGDYRLSERELLKKMLNKFSHGDLSLLDRGLGGHEVYLEYHREKQFFIHRAKTTGVHIPNYMKAFLLSGKKDQVILLKMKKKDRRTMQLRLILGPTDSEGKSIVFVTNLIHRASYPRREILSLYQKRWNCETLYNRVKNLLCMEKFHARSYNGIMQEIFANLLCLSLTAAAVAAVIEEEHLNPNIDLPNFKNATQVLNRHLLSVIDGRITGVTSKQLTIHILHEVRSVMYKVRPGRSYPRVSMQPIQPWNLKKSAKLNAFRDRVRA